MLSILRSLPLALPAALALLGCGTDVDVVVQARPGDLAWVRRLGRTSYSEPAGLAVTPDGGVIVAGRYYGDLDFGGGVRPAPNNNYQVYVARYDEGGQHVYDRTFGDIFAQEGSDVATLPDGSAVIVGKFGGTLELDGTTLESGDGKDAFAARLDPSGKVVWARKLGSEGTQSASRVAATKDGGVVVMGSFFDSIDLGTGPLPSSGGAATFLARLDAQGKTLWARAISSSAFIQGLAARPDGGAIVGGAFYAPIDVGGPQPIAPGDYQDGFVVSYGPDGAYAWHRVVGGPGYSDQVVDMSVNAAGDVAVAGSVDGPVDLGGGPLPVSDMYDTNGFVLLLDAKGTYENSKAILGDSTNYANAVKLDDDGHVLLAGNFYGSVNLGTRPIQSKGSSDVYVVELDAGLTPLYHAIFSGQNDSVVYRAAFAGEGAAYILGSAFGAVDFGDGAVPGSGYYDTFVARLAR